MSPSSIRGSAAYFDDDEPASGERSIVRALPARDAGQADAEWRRAALSCLRRGASVDDRVRYRRHRAPGPVPPRRALTDVEWELVRHPLEDRVTSEILARVAPVVLAVHERALVVSATVEQVPSSAWAARAVGWAARGLGVEAPSVRLAPARPVTFRVAPTSPPSLVCGSRALEITDPRELVFHAARQLVVLRPDYAVCMASPHTWFLEQVYVAALLACAPRPSVANVAAGALDLAAAIRKLSPADELAALKDTTRGLSVEDARARIKRWARALDYTACRAGLALGGDLATAVSVLAREPNGQERMHELREFWVSDACGAVRAALGIAVRAETETTWRSS